MNETTTVARAVPLALTNLADYRQLAEIMAPLFGGAPTCVLKLMAGAALGFDPYASLTGIHLIEGKTSLGSHLVASAIKRSDKYDYEVVERDGARQTTDAVCEVEFFERVAATGLLSRKFAPGWKSAGRLRYTIEDAHAKGWHLSQRGEKKGPWARTPRNMLFARVIVDGYKTFCPDLYGGALVYEPDELDTAAPPIDAEYVASVPGGQGETLDPNPQAPAEPPPASAARMIDTAQCDRISRLVNSWQLSWERFNRRLQEKYGTPRLRELSEAQAGEVEAALRRPAPPPATTGDATASVC